MISINANAKEIQFSKYYKLNKKVICRKSIFAFRKLIMLLLKSAICFVRDVSF